MPRRTLAILLSAIGGGVLAVGIAIVLVISMLSALAVAPATVAALADDCFGDVSSGGATPMQDPTQDQVAAAIYAQAHGLGLGDVAALVGIGVGLGETGLSNDLEGDCWSGSCSNGHTSSRGVFQQFYSWPPPGTAWSGTTYGPASGAAGTRFEGFNATNAWGPTGWATRDPRMNVAQSANMFFLGPDYGASMGLEDNALFQSLMSKDPKQVTSGQLVQIAQQVQQFPVAHMGSYEQNMTRALPFLERIKSGEIPVPPFTPPLEGMTKSATTPATKAALSGVTPGALGVTVTNAVSNTTTGSSRAGNDDGVLFLGDSVMEGLVAANNPPSELFGGPTVTRSLIGVSLEQVINAKTARFQSDTADLEQWRRDLSSGPSRVLVSLGTNPSSGNLDTLIDQFMSLAGGRQVYWFAQHYTPAQPMQAALEAAATRYPNLHIIPVLDLLPGGTHGTQMHPESAYAAMWSRAMDTLNVGPTQNTGGCVSAAVGGAVGVNPGSSPLPGEDQIPPAVGWAVNTPGGRNMTFYLQWEERWRTSPTDGYNIGSCGCGPTSLAMVVATLANQPNYTPPQAVTEQTAAGGLISCGTSTYQGAAFIQVGERYGLNGTFIGFDWNKARETLQQGGLVMASMGPGVFTTSAHYIVIRGITADGKFLVADPNNPDYTVGRAFSVSEFNFNNGMTAFLPGGKAATA